MENNMLIRTWNPLAISCILTLSWLLLAVVPVRAETVEYNLEIARQQINLTGRPVDAMTINGSIPGPVLRFTEGDLARIQVTNRMEVDTSIHWHGILVPPGMDGVPYISFPPIAPGQTFTYEFPIRQNGTYWYHSHTRLQEQSGIYGAIVIEPKSRTMRADRDYVVVLSDWTDEDPHQVLRTLKRGSEWFALQKGSSQSILGAARLGMLGEYFSRELQRMPAMDIADVAYDRFLVNGQNSLSLESEPGETIRLRIIDGSATTYFHLQFSGGPMQIIAADGIDVQPVKTDRFLISVAEVYDVLVRVPEQGTYEFRATAHDGSGFASIRLGKGMMHPAPDVPKPNLYHFMGHLSLKSLLAVTPAAGMGMGEDIVDSGRLDKPGMMMDMGGMDAMEPGMDMTDPAGMREHADHDTSDMGAGKMSMSAMAGNDDTLPMSGSMSPVANEASSPKMMANIPGTAESVANGYGNIFRPMAPDVSSSSSLAVDGMDSRRPWPPYHSLRATKPTSFDPDIPLREIRLTLDGDMERYVWFINNKALSESDSIRIREGEVTRFIMINRTMMHHPLHLHGHFFRVINGQGIYAPLKHTVDVAPMSTTVIEFLGNEVGDWFFHCHLLYHMKTGMARMVHYEEFATPAAVAPIRSRLYEDPWYFWGEADILTNMTEGFFKAANTRQTVTAYWEYGWQDVDENEWEGRVTWDYYLNRFFTVFTGIDFLGAGKTTEHHRGVIGITWLLPLNIESAYRFDTDSGGRFRFEKEFMLTPRLSLLGETEYDTHDAKWESKAGLRYTLTKSISLTGQYHTDFGWGIGAALRF